ncbi:MAG: endonuclease/exonuclease/phosphatase family protein [Nanoarchaeota archaeon]|jgi:endonuclease/exonuclease/phosphatase family metal-dependent hydrolase|nr:endonuclease/exonuclease/phosphatase family protein [Nanoarchaeota archaeon]
MKVKILQWNIWFQERAENILKLVKEINPDIMCFQEVTTGSGFNDGRDVAKFISEELGYYYNYSIAHKYEFPITPKGESNFGGNAIFSRFPIIEKKEFPIVNPDDKKDFPYERRTCCFSKIDLGNDNLLNVATAHSSYNNKFIENEDKIKEVRKLVDFFEKSKKNFIFTGDLNIHPKSESVKIIESSLKHCGPDYNEPTWTTKPFSFMGFDEKDLKWRLDYVFASEDVNVISSKIINTEYSDHLPILVEVDI